MTPPDLPPFQWRLEPAYVVSPLHLRLPDNLFAEFRAHVEQECANPDRVSHAAKLVGQIRNGEQIETSVSLPEKFRALFCELGRFYVAKLAEANGCGVSSRLQTEFVDSWIVKSREGDYNPAHSHGSQISGIIYVQVPPQVADPATTDGKLDFLYGNSNEPNLEFLGPRSIVPMPGDMFLFPAWLTHIVYPFRGVGERISYSFNLRAIR